VAGFFQFGLLLVCWLAALATLLVFLESWFALSGRHRFHARRASGAYGVVTVFVPFQGAVGKLDRVVRSVLNQSYPFIELILIYNEDDVRHVNLSREIRGVRTHVPIRVILTNFAIETESDRIRALEQAHHGARGRWWAVLQPDVVLDPLAIESTLEFAGSNEVTALALLPGIQCISFIERLLAPSMEYLLQMIRVADNRRERAKKITLDSPYLLLNREAFDVVNRINRMPGILNESGWTIWSYQLEGLRTFEGDGSRWIWREASIRSWASEAPTSRRHAARSVGFVVASIFVAVISVFGVAYGFAGRLDNFSGASILAFSAVSYALMGISYFLYARRLRASAWFAPFWFVSHIPACVLTVLEMRRVNGVSGVLPSLPESSHRAGDPGCRTR
jgi:hypothetical protein